MTSLNPNPELVDGVDVDAVAAAVRSCAGVDDLDGGQLGSVASYLPGRTMAGIKVTADRVTVQVRSRWAVPIAAVGDQVRAAVVPIIAPRVLDIVVSDIADPPVEEPAALPAGPSEGGAAWTPSSTDMIVAPSSAPITPIAAEIPTSSSRDWPPTTSRPGR